MHKNALVPNFPPPPLMVCVLNTCFFQLVSPLRKRLLARHLFAAVQIFHHQDEESNDWRLRQVCWISLFSWTEGPKTSDKSKDQKQKISYVDEYYVYYISIYYFTNVYSRKKESGPWIGYEFCLEEHSYENISDTKLAKNYKPTFKKCSDPWKADPAEFKGCPSKKKYAVENM